MIRALILFSVILFSVYLTEQSYFLEDDLINNINEEDSTLEASINSHKNTLDFIRNRLGSRGVQIPTSDNAHMYKSHDIAYKRLNNNIPRHFDAREQWKNCPNIGTIRDQGKCGSCWAVSTTSAFADRMCIATDGKFKGLLSAEDLAFCCAYCGYGCGGGYPIRAWYYFQYNGVVTGGDYNTKEGCAPYGMVSCVHGEDGTNSCRGQPSEINHVCPDKCYGNTSINFEKDRRQTNSSYYLSYNSIQEDVLTYGPIEASFRVYSDFYHYKKGVYIKSKNVTYLGGHAVKLIGWGEERGVPYWLLVNSWGTDWGINGTFKIRRGTNECGIDNSTTAGVPLIL